MLRLALYQPDIPQNTGAILRLAACFGSAVDIIEPCGFVWSDSALKRAAMDYRTQASCTRHNDWQSFYDSCRKANRRLILLTTKSEESLYQANYAEGDVLLLGRESAGVPQHIHSVCDLRVRIPMQNQARSLNIALAAAIALSEAIRQIGNSNLS